MNKKEIDFLIETALKAGAAIMDVFHDNNYASKLKADNSPVTEADLLSNKIIINALKSRFSDIPIISEESGLASFKERSNWQSLFLVDPLDGTKEFIKRTGDFTVNISYLSNSCHFGLIYAPAKKSLYYTDHKSKARKLILDDQSNFKSELYLSNRRHIADAPKGSEQEEKVNRLTVYTSRSHEDKNLQSFLKRLKTKYTTHDIMIKKVGSSLKLCLVAENPMSLYPRFNPTSEWDICAGHAILKAIGSNIYNTDTLNELDYNKKTMINPPFLACSDSLFTNLYR